MGIQLGSNFDINGAFPIDSRSSVADITARNAIIAGKRYEGLTVYVISNQTYYQLKGGITDGDWAEVGGGGGGLNEWTSATSYVIGDVVHLPADSKIYKCVIANTDVTFTPGNWVELSGETKHLDTFHSQGFEGLSTALFTSGQNAIYKTAGVFGGTLADETVNPISKGRSAKYTAGAASTDDWFDVETVTLDPKIRGEEVAVNLWADMSAFSTDAEFVVWDNTNNKKLDTSGKHVLNGGFDKTFYSFSIFIPASTLSISYGFHMRVAPVDTESFLLDDIEFTTNLYQYRSFLDEQNYSINQSTNALLDRTGELRFNLATATITNKGHTLLEAVDDVGNTRTYFRVTRDCIVRGNISSPVNTNQAIGFYINDSLVRPGNSFGSGGGNYSTCGLNIQLKKDDIISPCVYTTSPESGPGGTVISLAANVYVNFVATAKSDTVLAYINQNSSDSVVRVNTSNGYGSVNNKIRRFSNIVSNLGSAITYSDSATDGGEFTINKKGLYYISYSDNAGSAMNMGISLNSTQLTTAITLINNDDRIGVETPTSSGWSGCVSVQIPLKEGDVIRAHTDGAVGGLTGVSTFTISKAGLDSIVAVPVHHTAVIKDVKAAGTGGGTFTAGSWQTRDLNTLQDPSGIVKSLTSNQFVLGPGEYNMEGFGIAYAVVQHKIAFYNVTDTVFPTELIGLSNFNSNTGVMDKAFVTGTIVLTKDTTFELQHRGSVTRAGNGFGEASNFAVDEVYAQVRIVKTR